MFLTSRAVLRPILVLVFCLVMAGPALADLGNRAPLLATAPIEVSPPVSLTGIDRLGTDPAAVGSGGAWQQIDRQHSVTVYVSIPSTYLNATERQSIFDKITEKYTFASTWITFTTVQPTTGSYHTLEVTPGLDPDTALPGYGWAPGTSATIYGGMFTAMSAFGSTSSRVNGIGETAAHELDHILRGPGHTSGDPGDINASGTLVPATRRAQDNRSFSDKDKQQKLRNIMKGVNWLPYDARPKDECSYFRFIYGGDQNQWIGYPDDNMVSVSFQMSEPQYAIGIVTEEGNWDFSDGLVPPGFSSISLPPGRLIEFGLYDMMTMEWYPMSLYGHIMVDPASVILPNFSMNPVVATPYFSHAQIVWSGPFGYAYTDVTAGGYEGFQEVLWSATGAMEEMMPLRFDAMGEAGAVRLRWLVAPETPYTGFRVHRAAALAGEYKPVSADWIVSGVDGSRTDFMYLDAGASPGVAFFYRLEGRLPNGHTVMIPQIAQGSALESAPRELSLRLASGSPVRDRAVLVLGIPTARAEVTLGVFDVTGRRIATLKKGTLSGGFNTVVWNLTNDEGQRVSVGPYFVRLAAASQEKSLKLIVLR
jgi:hypothetical protein